MAATTIDDVILHLTEIIQRSKMNKSRLGYFPALYRKVTVAIKQGIQEGRFEDNARMERLDVLFANRYLEAYQRYQQNEPTTRSWRYTFDAASHQWRPVVLQHLLMGINTHINLDLGIAAAETVGDSDIQALKNDFIAINEILSSLIDEVSNELARIWPLMRFFDLLAGNFDEYLARFGIEYARDHAWDVAVRFAAAPRADWATMTDELDKEIEDVARAIKNPGWLLRIALFIVRITERRNIRRNIEILE